MTLLLLSPESRAAEALTTDQKNEQPIITVTDHGWTKEGDLVLAVKVMAGSKTLSLGRIPTPGSSEPMKTFSMGLSTLLEDSTKRSLTPLRKLPKKPYFGSGGGIIILNPGQAVTFGVAFPRPTEPSRAENGNARDYKFTLQIPDMPPVDFTIPFTPAPPPSP